MSLMIRLVVQIGQQGSLALDICCQRDRDEDSPEGGTPVSVKKRKVTTVTPISVSKIKRRSSSAYEKGEQSSPCTPRNYTHSSPCPSPVSNHLDSSGTFTHEELVWLQKDQLK